MRYWNMRQNSTNIESLSLHTSDYTILQTTKHFRLPSTQMLSSFEIIHILDSLRDHFPVLSSSPYVTLVILSIINPICQCQTSKHSTSNFELQSTRRVVQWAPSWSISRLVNLLILKWTFGLNWCEPSAFAWLTVTLSCLISFSWTHTLVMDLW